VKGGLKTLHGLCAFAPICRDGGIKFAGNLYAPKGRDKAPVIVAHGGGWQIGSPATCRAGSDGNFR
jgi:hypothetical protein